MAKSYLAWPQPKALFRIYTAGSGVWIKIIYFIRNVVIYRQRINDIELSFWGITWLYIELKKTGFWFYEFFMHTQASQKSKPQGKSKNRKPSTSK